MSLSVSRNREKTAQAVAVAGLLLVLLVPAASAQTRVETLRWTHPDSSEFAGFKVYTRTAGTGAYSLFADVGIPLLGPGDIYSHEIEIPEEAAIETVLTAYSSEGLESFFSNSRRLDPISSPPPPPVDDPTSSAVISAWDFNSVAAGSDPAGWVDTQAANSMQVDDSLFEVLQIDGNHVFGTRSQDPNIHSHYVTTGTDTWAAYEYSGRMRISDSNGGIGITAYSDYNQSDSYYRLKRQGSQPSFRLKSHPYSVNLVCSSDDTGVAAAADAWYRFRFQVYPESGATRVRAKAWADGTSEPASWQVDCRDERTERFAAGTVGVWSNFEGEKYWDALAVTDLSGSFEPPPEPEPPPPGQPGRPYLVQ